MTTAPARRTIPAPAARAARPAPTGVAMPPVLFLEARYADALPYPDTEDAWDGEPDTEGSAAS